MIPLDTIVACITGPVWGQAAVAGIRLSGPDAWTIAASVFPRLTPNSEPGKALYGVFKHGDDGLALPFAGTASYTGEPTVEFFIHGSPASVKLLIENCLKAGAREAEPGEFTLRAFINGKMDLTQAEAVADLVSARTEAHLHAAQRQRQGSLARELGVAYEALTNVIVSLEAWLDFSEEIGELSTDDLQTQLTKAKTAIQEIQTRGGASQMLREGIQVALLGRPNVGKSSLFNRLLGADRAIVTDIPGTTRDLLEGTIIHRGILFRFLDTAGLRETTDTIERLGIDRSHQAGREADLILYLYDDPAEPERAAHQSHPKTKPIRTKKDLNPEPTKDLAVSAVTGEGIDQLLDWLAAQAPDLDQPILINDRQCSLLNEAEHELANALASMNAGEPAEITLVPLRMAEQAIRRILGTRDPNSTGQGLGDDLLTEIFRKFCIGK